MHTDAQRYYGILGVDPAASDKAIRVAFRRRAKQLHPDAPTGDAAEFILLKRAYDILSEPNQRAGYDRDCAPAPQATPHRWTVPPLPPMPPPRPIPRRRGGVGFTRYVIAFIIMAAISLGGIQAMISLTEAPPSIRTRDQAGPSPGPSLGPSRTAADTAPNPEATTVAPGSSKSGFWDPTPAARKN